MSGEKKGDSQVSSCPRKPKEPHDLQMYCHEGIKGNMIREDAFILVMLLLTFHSLHPYCLSILQSQLIQMIGKKDKNVGNIYDK